MQINGTTELFGIIGMPVGHSLSPAMHNAAFAALGLNCVYLPLPARDAKDAVMAMKTFGIKGCSVTIPHKEEVVPFLDSIDPLAEKIGAVNTLVQKNGQIHGLNTDWIGANRALAETMPLKGKTVLLLGAGGSARAIGFGLLEAEAKVVLASRTAARGRELAARLGCPWRPLTDTRNLTADILVNATSVGMRPQMDAAPIDLTGLTNFQAVMDIVYAPLETKLLAAAGKKGLKTVNGLAMLLFQGAAQFELWTGQKAPVAVMRQALLASLPH